MADPVIGQLVRSKAGHDKGCVYVVVGILSTTYLLSDGRIKPLAHPKQKNHKHVQKINTLVEESIRSRLSTSGIVRDEEIKRAIKIYRNSNRIPLLEGV
jgi:ribosomal protein L14E/L6E/L27E